MSLALAITVGIAVFAVTLAILAFTSSLIADIAGLFRLLFVKQPYRALFRAGRWLLAGVAAASVVATIE